MSDMKGDYAIIDSVPLYNPMKSMMVTGASFLTFILLFFFKVQRKSCDRRRDQKE